jgi:hypothetical protein
VNNLFSKPFLKYWTSLTNWFILHFAGSEKAEDYFHWWLAAFIFYSANVNKSEILIENQSSFEKNDHIGRSTFFRSF